MANSEIGLADYINMNNFFQLSILSAVLLFGLISCDDDEVAVNQSSTGRVELKFDNAAGLTNSGSLISDSLTAPFDLTSSFDSQAYNISILKYFVNEITLEGENGLKYTEKIVVSPSVTKGIYLIDENDITSQRILIDNVPVGVYNKISFKVGIDSSIVEEGAGGGVLSQGGGPTDTDMFWNWNNGYLAFKMEGGAEASGGQAIGESVSELDANGYAFHVGGWSSKINNNRVISLNTTEPVVVTTDTKPELHMIMDVNKVLNGTNTIDFSKVNNIHSPAAGQAIADNLASAFSFNHIHQ